MASNDRPPRIVDTQPVLIARAVRELSPRGSKHLKTILRRMEFLRTRFADRFEADGEMAHFDAKEYGALAWLLEHAGFVEPIEPADVEAQQNRVAE